MEELDIDQVDAIGEAIVLYRRAIDSIARHLGHNERCMCDLCLARIYIHNDGSGSIDMDDFNEHDLPRELRRAFSVDFSRIWDDGPEVMRKIQREIDEYFLDSADLSKMEW